MSKLLRQIERMGNHDHICLIYRNQKEQFETAIPYIRIGLERNERCLYITDDNSQKTVITAMKKNGIDVEGALKKGSLIFATKNTSYLINGTFDPDALIKNVLLKAALAAKKDGYFSLRITGEMTWALGDEPGNDRLVEYEAKLNNFFPKYNASAICQYNQKRYPASIIKDIIYMHPNVAYGGSINKNYYYIPPKDYLNKNSDEEKVKKLLENIRITEDAFDERHKALQQFETVLLHLPSAVVVAEAPSGKLIVGNKQVDHIWRHPFIKSAKIGEYGAYHGFDKDGNKLRPSQWPLARSIANGETITNEVIRILRGDGTYGYINTSSAPIYDEDGKIIAGVVTFNDITDRIEQEKQKDEFMGIVSHELKTPVTSLKAFAQVLENRFRKAGDENAAHHLLKMDAQINRLTVLIGDLLDVTKIEAGKLQFHNSKFSFDELINEVVDEVQLTTNKHAIQKKGSSNKIIYGDRDRISQVLINLITNAIKYSPNSNQVILTVSNDKDTVTCQVTDFGVGIAKEKQDRIFERFYRVVSSDGEITYPGLGLGLYISREIIQRQGGKIWFESTIGKGSTFSFSLPLKFHEIKNQENTSAIVQMRHE